MGYYNIKAISHSSLRQFDPRNGGSPEKFKAYWDGRLETKDSPAMRLGRDWHSFLLEPETVVIMEEDFKISDKVVTMIDELFDKMVLKESLEAGRKKVRPKALASYESELLEIADEHQYQRNWKPETKLKKLMDAEAYWEFKRENFGKVILSPAQTVKLKVMMASIERLKKDSREASDTWHLEYIMGEVKGLLTFTEKEFFWDIDKPLHLKGKAKVDRIIVDPKNKRWWFIDPKSSDDVTTSGFIFKKNYYRQMGSYYQAIDRGMALKEDPRFKWQDLEFMGCYILGTSTDEYPISRIYYLDQRTLELGLKAYNIILEELLWHFRNDNWKSTKEQIDNHYVLEATPPLWLIEQHTISSW